MKITNVNGLPTDRIEEIVSSATMLQTLDDLLKWGREEPNRFASPATITNVVVQDEFTHDVIVTFKSGLVLVYDST